MRRVAWVPKHDIPPGATLRQHIAAQLDDRAQTATFEDDVTMNARSYAPADNRTAVIEAVELHAAVDPAFARTFLSHE